MDIFKRSQKLKIVDDGGIIAIANVKSYNDNLEFQESWTWKQLNDFILDKNKDNLIVFSTGFGGEWTMKFFIDEISKKKYFRKFEQSIEVTDGSLYLVPWSDLTCTLQFPDTILPDGYNQDLKIKIKNGFYRVVVKQLFDPEDHDCESEKKVNFIVELFSQNESSNTKIDSLAWTENFPNDDSIFLSKKSDVFDDFLKNMFEK